MVLRMPSDDLFKGLGAQALANETELQKFVEDHVIQSCGLRLVSSSLPGRPQLGYIDTAAVDEDGTPVIIEYKWDTIDRDTIGQVARYEHWLLTHRQDFEEAIAKQWPGQSTSWKKILLITIGYRYHQSAAWSPQDRSDVISIQYGYREDDTVVIQQLDRRKLPATGDPPRVLSKDRYLDQHLAKTTPAAREAFQLLRRRLVKLGLVEKIHGKNRVTYGATPRFAELSFTDVAVHVFFEGGDGIEDPEGRARRTERRGRPGWTCGIVSPADVEYLVALLAKETASTNLAAAGTDV